MRSIERWCLAASSRSQLVEAAKNLPKGDGATVVPDSGIENINQEVDDLFGLGQLHRILAQVEFDSSAAARGHRRVKLRRAASRGRRTTAAAVPQA